MVFNHVSKFQPLILYSSHYMTLWSWPISWILGWNHSKRFHQDRKREYFVRHSVHGTIEIYKIRSKSNSEIINYRHSMWSNVTRLSHTSTIWWAYDAVTRYAYVKSSNCEVVGSWYSTNQTSHYTSSTNNVQNAPCCSLRTSSWHRHSHEWQNKYQIILARMSSWNRSCWMNSYLVLLPSRENPHVPRLEIKPNQI